jgi:hypothetical protein
LARPYILTERHRRAALILHRHDWRPDEIAFLFDVSPKTIQRAILDAYREAAKVRRAESLIPESVS